MRTGARGPQTAKLALAEARLRPDHEQRGRRIESSRLPLTVAEGDRTVGDLLDHVVPALVDLVHLAHLEAVLDSDEMVSEIIVEELAEVKKKYGDARRTEDAEEAAEAGEDHGLHQELAQDVALAARFLHTAKCSMHLPADKP